MKTTVRAIRGLIASLIAGLTMSSPANAQEQTVTPETTDGTIPSPAVLTANQLATHHLLTNLVGQLSRWGVSVEVEKLTLNLNGFALVGAANALSNPWAEQLIPPAGPPAAVIQHVSPLTPRDGVLQLGGGTNLLVLDPTNLLSFASNLMGAISTNGFRLHVGQLTLNLNGYALVGVTNFLDQPRSGQQRTNSPSAKSGDAAVSAMAGVD